MARIRDKPVISNEKSVDNTVDDSNGGEEQVMNESVESRRSDVEMLSTEANVSSLTVNEPKRTLCSDIKVFFLETKPMKSQSQSTQTIGRQPKSMQLAFTSMKSKRFDTNWIKEEEVVTRESVSVSDKCIFILDSFEGRAYDHLVSKKARIVGPLAVLYCFSSECQNRFKTIPEKAIPIYSQCMRKMNVCFSGFDGQRKTDLVSMAEKMSANVHKDFSKRVTHLVTDSVRTKKYSVAKRIGTSVVLSSWVDDCWHDHQHNLSFGGEESIVSKYSTKMFNDLIITVSQVGIDERNEVMRIVRLNGGQYSPSLKLTARNCLLLLKEPNGEKFKYAQMKSIPCLDIKWLYESFDKGYALPEDQYLIQSTPSQCLPSSPRSEANSKSKELNSNHCNQNNSSQSLDIRLETSLTSNFKDNSNEEIIKKIEILKKSRKEEPFLEGCDIYVVGFDRPTFECIKSCLISSGSVVYNEFKDLVTHVIVGPNTSDAQMDQLLDNKSSKLVTIDWFFESFAQNECCDCSKFEVKNMKSVEDNTSKPLETKSTKSKDLFKGPVNLLCPKTAQKALQKFNKESIFDSKRNHKSLGDRKSDKIDVQWNDVSNDEEEYKSNEGIEQKRRTNESLSSHSDRETTEDIDLQVDDTVKEVSKTVRPPDTPWRFLFSGYDDSTKDELRQIVQQLNGLVFDTNYVTERVTHLVIRDPSATEKTLSAIASGIWVLKEEYLYESKDKGVFVDETPFEWGFQVSCETETKSVRKRLMVSALDWRKHLTEESQTMGRRVKAFDDWKALIVLESKFTIPYSQVLKCGNAEVVVLDRDLDESELNGFTYAFIDDKTVDEMSTFALKVAKRFQTRHKLFKIDFISHYILNGPKSDTKFIVSKTLVRDLQTNKKRVCDETEEQMKSSKRRK